jgi:hypothetical protein
MLLNGGIMKIDKLKKEELLAYTRKIVQENKMLKKQLENEVNVDDSTLNNYALAYRKEERNGEQVHVSYVVKCDLNNAIKAKEIVETTKELALYKLELNIIDYFINKENV